MKPEQAVGSRIDSKIVGIIIGAIIITAVATGLVLTYGKGVESLTTTQSAHALAPVGCVQDWTTVTNQGGDQVLLTCSLSDGGTLHCLEVTTGSGAALYCTNP